LTFPTSILQDHNVFPITDHKRKSLNTLDEEDMTMLTQIAKIFKEKKQEEVWAKVIKNENETQSTPECRTGSKCGLFATDVNTDGKVL